MAATLLNNQQMLTSMENRGTLYHFDPGRVVGFNGNGVPVEAPYATLRWHWKYLTDTEMAYLVTTVLGGVAGLEVNQADYNTVYDETKAEATFAHAMIYRPTYQTFRNGIFLNVQLMVDQLV